jgi:hypothetical protein
MPALAALVEVRDCTTPASVAIGAMNQADKRRLASIWWIDGKMPRVLKPGESYKLS